MSTDRSTDLASRRGPATVVIGQRLRPDRHDAYRRWQDDVTAAAARFPGYLGSEATPVPDQQGDATIIYRFDTAEHLDGWLTSTARDDLVASGEDLFDAPPTQQVLVGGDDDEPLATVVVSHAVRPADEATFLEWQDRMTEAESRSPGFRGSELFPPVPGVQAEWTALYRFASAADLERWMASDERRRLLDEGERFQDFRLRRVSGTFGSWFPATGSGADATPMPNWKSALSVLVGLYPTVVLLTLALGKIWPSAQLWESLLLGNVLSVTLLTWVIMPTVNRVFAFWLTPRRDAEQPRTDVTGAVVSILFLTVAAAVFWLVTVVIWTLP